MLFLALADLGKLAILSTVRELLELLSIKKGRNKGFQKLQQAKVVG